MEHAHWSKQQLNLSHIIGLSCRRHILDKPKESDELSPRDHHNWGRRGFKLYYLQTSHISEDLDPV